MALWKNMGQRFKFQTSWAQEFDAIRKILRPSPDLVKNFKVFGLYSYMLQMVGEMLPKCI